MQIINTKGEKPSTCVGCNGIKKQTEKVLCSRLQFYNGVRQTQTADWQANKVNIVVKSFNRFPIPKNRLLNDLNFRDRESVRASHNKV